LETAKLVLEYVRVLLSPQIIGGIVTIIVLFTLSNELKALFRRIAKIRFPGGSEVSTSQIERAIEAPISNSEPPNPTDTSPVAGKQNPTPQDFELLRQLYDAERAQSHLWEYRYLNFFLVRHTQQFLDWLITLPNPTSVGLADAHWMQFIPDPNERFAILNALMTHHLVEQNMGLLHVTEKGREYAQWRGPLPQLPSK